MERIHSLTIPEDILNDDSLSMFEMFMYAFERQYPNATREEEARAMHIKPHSLYDHKRRMNNKKVTAQISSAEIRSAEIRSAQISSAQTCTPQICTETDVTINKPSREEKRKHWVYYQNMINGLKSPEDYESKKKRTHQNQRRKRLPHRQTG